MRYTQIYRLGVYFSRQLFPAAEVQSEVFSNDINASDNVNLVLQKR